MEITYIGHSCFKIKGKTLSLVIDPYTEEIGYKLPKLEADVVLCTHDHFDHHNVAGVKNARLVIDSPGEYETSGVFIYGKQVFHDDIEGKERGINTIYTIDIDGLTIMHLGDLGHELSQETMEKVSNVDVLMIPVGGKYTIDSKVASKVISALEPGIVLPMHYKTDDLKGIEGLDGLDKFLEEMGVENNIKHKEELKLGGKMDVPEDTEVVILKPNH